jgi:hypothetical protein
MPRAYCRIVSNGIVFTARGGCRHERGLARVGRMGCRYTTAWEG